MASSNNHDPENLPDDQSIPLQDLSRPPETVTTDGGRRPHRRMSSSSFDGRRERYGLGRRSLTGSFGRTYQRIAEDSPSSRDRHSLNPFQPGIAPRRPGVSPYMSDGDGPILPDDARDFQQAISSVGLDLNGPPAGPSPIANPPAPFREGIGIDSPDGPTPSSHPSYDNINGHESYFSPTEPIETDTTPLTNQRYL